MLERFEHSLSRERSNIRLATVPGSLALIGRCGYFRWIEHVHRVQSPFLCFHLKDGFDVRVGDDHVVQLQLRRFTLSFHGSDQMPAAITLDAPTAAELRPKESDGGEEEEEEVVGVAVAMSAHHHQGDEGGQENGGQHPDGHDHHRLHGDCGSHSGGGGGGQAATRQEQKEQEEEEEESNHGPADCPSRLKGGSSSAEERILVGSL
ncbi:hypothetical protein INR49_006416 [Caranx melampygus]|nr:hypothetical protein INR49_006416 [Caranx melampygus]